MVVNDLHISFTVVVSLFCSVPEYLVQLWTTTLSTIGIITGRGGGDIVGPPA